VRGPNLAIAVTTQQAFALAIQHHEAGRPVEAEALYRQILAFNPQSPVVWSHLGIALADQARFSEAVAAYQRALLLQPDYPEALFNLGAALAGKKRLDEAVAALRRALQLAPDHAEGHNNLGNALAAQGKSAEALAAYYRALEIKPDYPEAHMNLGIALAERERFEEAIAAYHRAIQFKPDYARVHYNLGNALRSQGRWDEAVSAYERALQLQPSYPEARMNLGIALAEQEERGAAIAAYRSAIQSKSDFPEAHYNLGKTLGDLGRFDEAMAEYHQAIQLQPRYAEAYNNLGNTLKDEGELEQAFAAYRRAMELKPATALFFSNLIYALPFSPACDAPSLRAEQACWNRLYVEPLRSSRQPHANDPDPARRLKIGYVSPDFRAHAASFFLAPLLEAHDHERFEIHCYANVRRPDAMTARLQKSADVWHDVSGIADDRLAECIREDRIDILVDLAMHTSGNRLPVFARQPAPVQVSWLAYPGSTGLETMDYRLTDAYIDPPDENADGSGERPVRLPDAWCCYEPVEECPPVGPLPAERQGSVTFGSLNQFCKIHEGLLRCWVRLLQAVPGARLLLVCAESRARQRARALFTAYGIAEDRVHLVVRQPWPDFIRLFHEIDIALDSFPCNGMTTTCHALWMGVPVVTLAGTTAVARAGCSLLHTAGLSDWVARNEEEYLAIATQWANDLPRLAELRATLRPRLRASPLMDAPRFARHVEAAYRTMWQRWCTNHPSPPP